MSIDHGPNVDLRFVGKHVFHALLDVSYPCVSRVFAGYTDGIKKTHTIPPTRQEDRGREKEFWRGWGKPKRTGKAPTLIFVSRVWGYKCHEGGKIGIREKTGSQSATQWANETCRDRGQEALLKTGEV